MSKKKKKAKWVWKLNTATYLDIIDLAMSRGKKEGDSMRDEFEEILRTQRDEHNLLGVTNEAIKEMIDNMSEQDVKMPSIKDLNE